MAAWYCGSTKWSAVTAWAASTAYSIGDIRRQLATPTVGNERVWRCTTAGTSGGSEPSWTLTKGSTTTDNTAVWTEITGNSTYGWTAPHARIASSLSWMAAGDTLYVSQAHAATQASSITWASPGTAASPCNILCADDGATPPTTLATTATESAVGASNYDFTFYGATSVYGLGVKWERNAYIAGYGAGSSHAIAFEQCTFTFGTQAVSGGVIACGYQTTRDRAVRFIDCTLVFSHVGQYMMFVHSARAESYWRGGSIALTGTVPTTLCICEGQESAGSFDIIGANLAAFTSGKNLCSIGAQAEFEFRFINCKLGSSVALSTGTSNSPAGVRAQMINCDSADTQTRFAQVCYQGTEVSETTIVRTSGASDGTTSFSRKIVTTASAELFWPYRSLPITFWNETTGSAITVTVPTVTDNVTLTDVEAWIEVEYLGTAGFPLGSVVTDRNSNPVLGSAANQTTNSDTWTTTGLTTPVKQQLNVTVTPQEKGLIRVYVCVAKVSTTVYYDPLVQVS